MSKFGVVILAAGQGKRMGGEQPKVLRPLGGRPIISYLVEAVEQAGITDKPVVVVCDEHTLVQDVLGERCDYVVQEEQLGTAHALSCAEEFLKRKGATEALVLYGDHPFLKAETLGRLKEVHQRENKALTLMTTTLPDFESWRSVFKSFGRILRDEKRNIAGIVESKDATEAERNIPEVNPMYCCFKAEWLWENLKKIGRQNASGEYYLTDLVKMAFLEGQKITDLSIDNLECLGLNRPEELAAAEALLKLRGVGL